MGWRITGGIGENEAFRVKTSVMDGNGMSWRCIVGRKSGNFSVGEGRNGGRRQNSQFESAFQGVGKRIKPKMPARKVITPDATGPNLFTRRAPPSPPWSSDILPAGAVVESPSEILLSSGSTNCAESRFSSSVPETPCSAAEVMIFL